MGPRRLNDCIQYGLPLAHACGELGSRRSKAGSDGHVPHEGTVAVMDNAKRPIWFIAAAIILLLWALAGVVSFAAPVLVGEKMAAGQGAWDLGCPRALPAWFAWGYALATLAALAGSVALLMRSRHAAMLCMLFLAGGRTSTSPARTRWTMPKWRSS